jgi:hypothetical protein
VDLPPAERQAALETVCAAFADGILGIWNTFRPGRDNASMAEYNVLSFVEHTVASTVRRRRMLFFSRWIETEVTNLDFAIDGKPLRTMIQDWSGLELVPEEASFLTAGNHRLAVEQIDRLLGRLPHQHGSRGWLLFCPCGDEACGGLTTDIQRVDGVVRWSRIGWDVSYLDETDFIDNAEDFVFDAHDYDRVLLAARKEFTRTAAGASAAGLAGPAL